MCHERGGLRGYFHGRFRVAQRQTGSLQTAAAEVHRNTGRHDDDAGHARTHACLRPTAVAGATQQHGRVTALTLALAHASCLHVNETVHGLLAHAAPRCARNSGGSEVVQL